MAFERHNCDIVDARLKTVEELLSSSLGSFKLGLTACQLLQHAPTNIHHDQGKAPAC